MIIRARNIFLNPILSTDAPKITLERPFITPLPIVAAQVKVLSLIAGCKAADYPYSLKLYEKKTAKTWPKMIMPSNYQVLTE